MASTLETSPRHLPRPRWSASESEVHLHHHSLRTLGRGHPPVEAWPSMGSQTSLALKSFRSCCTTQPRRISFLNLAKHVCRERTWNSWRGLAFRVRASSRCALTLARSGTGRPLQHSPRRIDQDPLWDSQKLHISGCRETAEPLAGHDEADECRY